MIRYPVYKNSGVDWIGEIPKTWEIIPLKRLTQVKRGASPRPIDDPKYFDGNGEFGWVRIADVTASERYLENTTQKLSELGASLSVKRYPGDLFLSIAGTVGKPIISKIKCCIHDGFVWFPYLKINPEFLYYIFSAGLAYQGLGKLGTQLNLNTDTVGYIKLPLPSQEEICQIVKYLDKNTAKIDSLIIQKQKLIKLIKEERTAIINQAVTKGINPDVEMKDSGIEWIGKMPKYWEVRKLKYLVHELQSGVSVNSYEYSANSHEVGILKTSCVYDYTFRPEENKKVLEAELGRTSCPIIKNSIIISRMNTPELVGACGYIEYDYPNLFLPDRLWQLRVKSEKEVWVPWLYRLMTSFQFRDLLSVLATGTSSSMKNISHGDLLNILIPYPEIQEQIKIFDFIQTETTKIDNVISRIEKEIKLLQEYRTALISEVVTGKIDVREEVGS